MENKDIGVDKSSVLSTIFCSQFQVDKAKLHHKNKW